MKNQCKDIEIFSNKHNVAELCDKKLFYDIERHHIQYEYPSHSLLKYQQMRFHQTKYWVSYVETHVCSLLSACLLGYMTTHATNLFVSPISWVASYIVSVLPSTFDSIVWVYRSSVSPFWTTTIQQTTYGKDTSSFVVSLFHNGGTIFPACFVGCIVWVSMLFFFHILYCIKNMRSFRFGFLHIEFCKGGDVS